MPDILIYEGEGWKFTSPEGSDSLHVSSLGVGLHRDDALELANSILEWAQDRQPKAQE